MGPKWAPRDKSKKYSFFGTKLTLRAYQNTPNISCTIIIEGK